MHLAAVNHRVGAGKVDILEYTQRLRLLSAVVADAAHALFVKDEDLARLDIANEGRPHRIECAGFGGNDVASVRRLPVAERAEAMLIAGGDELRGGHDGERIGSLQFVHRAVDGLFNRTGRQALLRNDVGNDLGVACRVEDGSLEFQL